jgi:hypothetical protein
VRRPPPPGRKLWSTGRRLLERKLWEQAEMERQLWEEAEAETGRGAFQYVRTEDRYGGHLFDIPNAGRSGMERRVDVVMTYGPPRWVLDEPQPGEEGEENGEKTGEENGEDKEVGGGETKEVEEVQASVPNESLMELCLDGINKKEEQKEGDRAVVGCEGWFAAGSSPYLELTPTYLGTVPMTDTVGSGRGEAKDALLRARPRGLGRQADPVEARLGWLCKYA